jgi:hypothetical protein
MRMDNLTLPVFDTEAQLIDAIHAGSCHKVQAANAQASLVYPVNMKAAHTELLGAPGRANVSSKNVGLVAWHDLDAAKLAERAHYR